MTRWRSALKRRHIPSLMPLDDALEALGGNGDMGRRTAEVPVANIVGSAGRASDFDQEFRLVNKALQDRWEQLFRAVESGFEPPAVHLVQLGELYFVIDGHHRVSVARAVGRLVVTALVHRICTIAYAKCCLRMVHLPTKAAERRFLERVPLPGEVRQQLWLDEPAQWTRLADAAEAWGLRRSLQRGRPLRRAELAATWWTEDVEPLVGRLRAAGVGDSVMSSCTSPRWRCVIVWAAPAGRPTSPSIYRRRPTVKRPARSKHRGRPARNWPGAGRP